MRMRILITGANRGLGKEIASQLLNKHSNELSVVMTARRTADLQHFKAATTPSIEAIELNLDEKSPDSFQHSLQQLRSLGKFDFIFHTASPYFKTRLLESTPEQTASILMAQQNEFLLLTSLAKELTSNGSMLAAGAVVSAVTGPTNVNADNPWYAGMFSFYKSSLRALMACLYQELPNNRVIHVNLGTFCDEADTQNEHLKSGKAMTTQQVAAQLIEAAMKADYRLNGFNIDVMSKSELAQLEEYCPKKRASSLVRTSSNLFTHDEAANAPLAAKEALNPKCSK